MFDQIAQDLKQCKKILVITGAGMSADSGVPTYRGKGGIYNNDVKRGLKIEDVINIRAFKQNPELAWEFLKPQIEAVQKANPHAGYYALNKILKSFPEANIFTQNVDGLHKKSGFPAYEVHGNKENLICSKCDKTTPTPPFDSLNIPHLCDCGGAMRTSSVMFGESVPSNVMDKLERILNGVPDAVIGIGSSFAFNYMKWPFILADQKKWLSIDINPQKSYISHLVKYYVPEKANSALEKIAKYF